MKFIPSIISITVCTLFLFFSLNVFSHQPKLINYSPTLESPHKVNEPEISKAYYAKLTGKPHYYKISSDKDFLFYTGILTPSVSESYKWFSIEVIDKNNNIIYYADGKNFEWKKWYEPYARDWYWKGPEVGIKTDKEFKTSFAINSGEYFIKVTSKNNTGNYSLAVGEAEFFGTNLWEKILTWTPIIFYIGPYMDIFHWSKFDIRAFIPHIVLLVLFFSIYFMIKKLFFKKRRYFG